MPEITVLAWEAWNNQPRIPRRLGTIHADDYEDAWRVAKATYPEIAEEWLSVCPAVYRYLSDREQQ